MRVTTVSPLLLALLVLPAAAQEPQARVEAARAAVKEFQATLQTELQKAVKEGGPVKAIDVCSTAAGQIAKETSNKHGLRIARTSLKTRNSANAPDAWERATLEQFEQRRGQGADPATLEHHEVVKKDGKETFRYMKAIAIPADGPCLKCHGQQIDPAVQAKLKELYPADKATGYQTGELRGAFTVTQ